MFGQQLAVFGAVVEWHDSAIRQLDARNARSNRLVLKMHENGHALTVRPLGLLIEFDSAMAVNSENFVFERMLLPI